MTGLALGFAAFIAAAEVHAAACTTRAGAVVLRDACRKRETSLDLADFGIQGPAGMAGAMGPSGRAALHLDDAAGVEVGPVVYVETVVVGLGPTDPAILALIVGDAVGGAALIQIDLSNQASGVVHYASADCTGPALADGNSLISILRIVNDTVFRPTTPSPPMTAQSSELRDQRLGCSSITPRGGCCRPPLVSPGTPLFLTQTTTLSALGLSPPFHVSE